MKKTILWKYLAVALAAGLTSFAGNAKAQDLVVGSNSSDQTTNFTSGTHSYANTYVGYLAGDSNNLLSIGNTNTLLANSGDLYLGYGGNNNSMIISNGGNVVNNNGWIGYSSTASNNSVLVSDAGTLWTNAGDLTIGVDGSGNTLMISNGATVGVQGNNNGIVIGMNANSSNNTVLVTGTNANGTPSSLTNAMNFYVGDAGASNSMIIANGGEVFVKTNAYIGYTNTSSNNSVLVTGSNSLWTNSGDLYVGYSGSGNSMVISNGGTVIVGGSGSTIGNGTGNGPNGNENQVILTGSNSVFNNSAGGFTLGNYGNSNTITVSSGARLLGRNDTIGKGYTNDLGIANQLIVTGAQSLYSNAANLYIGWYGTGGLLLITNGAHAIVSSETYVGYTATDSNNRILVSGPGSVLSNSVYGSIHIGYNGSGNSLVISNGGRVIYNNDGLLGDQLGSSNNSAVVTGAGSLWNVGTMHNIIVGQGSGGNSLLIANGGVVTDNGGYIGISTTSTNNSVLVTGNNSLWSNSENLHIGGNSGEGGSGVLTVADGGSVIAISDIAIASASNSGTLNIGSLGGSDQAGTITTPTIAFGSGTGTINFNQTDTATLTSSISGLGTVQQLGSGTTILTRSNTFTGTTIVTAGTLLANNTSGSAMGASSVLATNSGTLGGNGSIGGATTIASGGNLAPGSAGSGALTFTSGLSLQDGATTTFLINATNSFTSINLIGSSITYAGALVFNLTSYTPSQDDEFTLFNMTGGATTAGNFSSVEALVGESGLFFTDDDGIWSGSNNGTTYQFATSTGELAVESVPEPSSYALIGLGLGSIGMLMVLRRKRSV